MAMRLPRLFRRRRSRPKPVVFRREWQANPNFPGQNEAAVARRRRLLLSIEMAAVFGLIIYLSIFSPLFAITNVKVEATPDLLSKGARTAVDRFISGSSWGLIPRANYLLLKPKTLIRSIEHDLRDVTAFEEIAVAKHFPDELTIKLVERKARYLWRTQDAGYGLDDRGTVVSHFTDASANPDNLIIIKDENNIPIQVGSKVIRDSTLNSLTLFIQGLFEQNLTLETVSIPSLDCPLKQIVEPSLEESDDRGASNLNINRSLNLNANRVIVNANNSVEPVVCVIPDLVLNNLDFRANLAEGWQILFLANDETASQLNKLRQFLTDSSKDPKTLSYVDIRFGERIYFK